MTRSPEEEFGGLQRFDAVDATGEEQMFVRFLELVEAEPSIQALRRRTYELLRIHPSAVVADVGCGLGTAARELAAAGVRALGFDASEAMVDEARRRSATDEVAFDVADVVALPLDDGALHGYRAERLYQHLDDPARALAEARRVLAPGGRIVLADQDWDTLVVDGERELGRRVSRAFADSIKNGSIGSRFRALLLDAGFDEVEVVAETFVSTGGPLAEMMATISARAAAEAGVPAEAWLDDQRRRLAGDRFFAAFTMFVASGTNPAEGAS